MRQIRVLVWGEFVQERTEEAVARVYPRGIHEAIAEHLRKQPDMAVRTATLDEPEHGLSESVLKDTDVLIWWGHVAHDKVSDHVVERVCRRVLEGMGLARARVSANRFSSSSSLLRRARGPRRSRPS